MLAVNGFYACSKSDDAPGPELNTVQGKWEVIEKKTLLNGETTIKTFQPGELVYEFQLDKVDEYDVERGNRITYNSSGKITHTDTFAYSAKEARLSVRYGNGPHDYEGYSNVVITGSQMEYQVSFSKELYDDIRYTLKRIN